MWPEQTLCIDRGQTGAIEIPSTTNFQAHKLIAHRINERFSKNNRPQTFFLAYVVFIEKCKYSVNPPASVQRVPCPRPRPRLAVGSVIGIPRRNLTMRRGYDVSGAGTSSSHPHARLCSGLRFHGRNRSTSSTARPPAWAHASR